MPLNAGRHTCTIESNVQILVHATHFGLLLFVHINIKACLFSSTGEPSFKSLADPSSLLL